MSSPTTALEQPGEATTPQASGAARPLPDQPIPAMAKAKTPIGAGQITLLGVLMALVTGVLGLIGIHDALVAGDLLTGRAWIESSIEALDGLQPQWWAVPAGAALVLLGLWMLSVSLRRRPRTAVALQSKTGVFLRPADVQKLAARAAEDVDGVVSAKIRVSRRAANVVMTVTGEDERIGRQAQAAVAERLAVLDPPPRLRIKTRTGVTP